MCATLEIPSSGSHSNFRSRETNSYVSSRRKEEPSQVSIGSGKGRHKGKVRRRSGRKPLGAQIRFISKLAVEKQEKKETKSTKTNTLSKGRGVARREAGISCPGTPRINISVYWICSRAYARTTTTTSKQKKKRSDRLLPSRDSSPNKK